MPIEFFFSQNLGAPSPPPQPPWSKSSSVPIRQRDSITNQSPILVTFISFKYHDIRNSSDSPTIINLPSFFSTIHLSQREREKNQYIIFFFDTFLNNFLVSSNSTNKYIYNTSNHITISLEAVNLSNICLLFMIRSYTIIAPIRYSLLKA